MEFNFRVIGLDPGGTTGWSTYSAMLMPGPEYLDQTWEAGHLGPDDHHLDLYEFLGLQQVETTIVVCESFEFRQYKQRDNINLMSREYIGVAKLFAQERLPHPVVFQTAGAAKGFVTDEKLKAMGLWVPGWKHAMDARRHTVHYLVSTMKRYDLIRSWKDLV